MSSTWTQPSSRTGTGFTVKPISAAVAGLVPCAESGTSTVRRVSPSPLAAIAALIAIMPQKLAMGAGLRRERNSRHAGQRREIAGELAHELERALHGRDRLQGMNVADAGQPRHALVEAGIVLHGAGAEREQPGVDAEVLLRQAHVMAHGLGLGEAGQADLALALEPAETRRERLRLVEIDAGRVDAADLEDQRLLLLQRAVAGEGRVLGCAGRRRRSGGLGGSAC